MTYFLQVFRNTSCIYIMKRGSQFDIWRQCRHKNTCLTVWLHVVVILQMDFPRPSAKATHLSVIETSGYLGWSLKCWFFLHYFSLLLLIFFSFLVSVRIPSSTPWGDFGMIMRRKAKPGTMFIPVAIIGPWIDSWSDTFYSYCNLCHQNKYFFPLKKNVSSMLRMRAARATPLTFLMSLHLIGQ